jgi:hydroxymethylpyrimidine/phosphomethylpyrimidine kinase
MTAPLPHRPLPVALTIAGSDPSGGAGLQADLKTFHQHQVYGMSVITLLTVQNTQTVLAVELLPAKLVMDQLLACLSDIPPQAAKTGALGSREVIVALAAQVDSFTFPLVVDPVMISKHQQPLMSDTAVSALIEHLLPKCFLVTPNLPEAEKLIGRKIETISQMKSAAKEIAQLGPQHVFLKGGHLSDSATDILYTDGEWFELSARRIETKHTHGTGCTISAAITAWLARGASVIAAVHNAKQFIHRAIADSPGLGQGYGPVNHFVPVE